MRLVLTRFLLNIYTSFLGCSGVHQFEAPSKYCISFLILADGCWGNGLWSLLGRSCAFSSGVFGYAERHGSKAGRLQGQKKKKKKKPNRHHEEKRDRPRVREDEDNLWLCAQAACSRPAFEPCPSA